MKISNSVSFGAILIGQWSNVLKDARTLAAYRNHEHKSDYYTKKLDESLLTIEDFKPNEIFDIKVNSTQNYEKSFKIVNSHGTTIFREEGDELNFVNSFANAINTGRII